MTEVQVDLNQLFEGVRPIFWKKGRLETFEHWPFKSKDYLCNPENMARAGFYAIGGKDEPDLVECFICCKQLDGWEPGDDPWQEHKKHQQNCQFITLGKPDQLDLTLIEYFQLMQIFYKNEMKIKHEKTIESIKRSWKEIASKIPEALKRS